MNIKPTPSNVLGVLVAGGLSLIGWVTRRLFARIDNLEKTAVTRGELDRFKLERAAVDDERTASFRRLEDKIDEYQRAVTTRIDKLLDQRGLK